ncbi:DUF982 domain-containing protein [Agrobacterium sp. a22-2]|uniref:DUF982 domain-containing protein n=1 Tax=Agrobacterium sp. a22-2 TaxID=2283840 RepID=UPI00144545E9|nr:DUF982 domain-containing protein [Agrobacterium sp. a22-2]NKN35849.1 DUF982 domain-containing protein [Agrobacterium sp. a22-2]
MKPDMFETPVTILTGLGIPTEIPTVTHAYELLMDWPADSYDPARALALKACMAALSGDIEAETARSVFAAFAEKHDLIAPDINGVVAGRNRGSNDPHLR